MNAKPTHHCELLGVLLIAADLMVVLSLWSYDAQSTDNLVGLLGVTIGKLLASAFGYAAWLVPIGLWGVARACIVRTQRPAGVLDYLPAVLLTLLSCGFLHLVQLSAPAAHAFGGHLVGGRIGALVGNPVRRCLGLAGGYLVCLAAFVAALELGTPFSLAKLLGALGAHLSSLAQSIGNRLKTAWQSAELLEQRTCGRHPARVAAQPVKAAALAAPLPALVDDCEADAVVVDLIEPPGRTLRVRETAVTGAAAPSQADVDVATIVELAKFSEVEHAQDSENEVTGVAVDAAPSVRAATVSAPARSMRAFMLPRSTLLALPVRSKFTVDELELKQNAMRLEEKLAAFGIAGRVDGIHPGPVVTMYEFAPQGGAKISKIVGLADDLALALEARVRVVAPLPGTARVGFELPNEHREQVSLRELLEDDRWRLEQGALPIALGKDISGEPVYGDLSQMPHLLVAGATGAGKSIGLNVMLASLLMRKSPADLRLVLIDPKVVELAGFEGIPHLLLPVVTDMKKASRALAWAVDEMERRYQLFAAAGARNLQTYNRRVEMAVPGRELPATACAARSGEAGDEARASEASQRLDSVKLPSIVVVVDEFADLMMVAAKHVESAVARLAQKARAAGIHLIVATQRPSVDVITGMIKANFPARISYKVSQREDSKTILGRTGAEQLLGKGDMLCVLPGVQELTRVHNAYIGEEEVKALCDYLRAQGEPTYDDSILEVRREPRSVGGVRNAADDGAEQNGAASDDQLYDEAVAVVAHAGSCSISQLQRVLKVGYNKAAKIVARMEQQGVVGPATGKAGARREVFVGPR